MTQDEIVEMAEQAGVDMSLGEHWSFFIEELEAFAKLVAEKAIKEALAQPEKEPIGQLCEEFYGRGQVMWFNKPVDGSYVYTTPPQSTWVGLTDREIHELWTSLHDDFGNPPSATGYERVIEAKLKQKNGYTKEKNND